ncbi:hypothetical protein TGRH88_047340 [Toxoplasma gondii]|uniref:Uncharacterized protein n=1 Tax=Toxoplasma gondii TaxID=5811 RepID=A0A7J6K0U7_TOXGO|nr:hypothetical protein TGRH88_047340 [Toxoplasma gondii]
MHTNQQKDVISSPCTGCTSSVASKSSVAETFVTACPTQQSGTYRYSRCQSLQATSSCSLSLSLLTVGGGGAAEARAVPVLRLLEASRRRETPCMRAHRRNSGESERPPPPGASTVREQREKREGVESKERQGTRQKQRLCTSSSPRNVLTPLTRLREVLSRSDTHRNKADADGEKSERKKVIWFPAKTPLCVLPLLRGTHSVAACSSATPRFAVSLQSGKALSPNAKRSRVHPVSQRRQRA